MEFTFLTFGLVRLAVPLLILRMPLPGLLLAAYADWLDWRVLGLDERPDDHAFYQRWDKLLDTYYLALALYVTRSWPDRRCGTLALGLFGWRLVGVAIFTVVGWQPLLLIFPNLFENFWVLYYLHRWLVGRDLVLDSGRVGVLVVLAIAGPQLAREYLLHVLQDRPWDMVRIVAARQLDVALWTAVYLLPQIAALAYLARRAGAPLRLRPLRTS